MVVIRPRVTAAELRGARAGRDVGRRAGVVVVVAARAAAVGTAAGGGVIANAAVAAPAPAFADDKPHSQSDDEKDGCDGADDAAY